VPANMNDEREYNCKCEHEWGLILATNMTANRTANRTTNMTMNANEGYKRRAKLRWIWCYRMGGMLLSIHARIVRQHMRACQASCTPAARTYYPKQNVAANVASEGAANVASATMLTLYSMRIQWGMDPPLQWLS